MHHSKHAHTHATKPSTIRLYRHKYLVNNVKRKDSDMSMSSIWHFKLSRIAIKCILHIENFLLEDSLKRAYTHADNVVRLRVYKFRTPLSNGDLDNYVKWFSHFYRCWNCSEIFLLVRRVCVMCVHWIRAKERMKRSVPRYEIYLSNEDRNSDAFVLSWLPSIWMHHFTSFVRLFVQRALFSSP